MPKSFRLIHGGVDHIQNQPVGRFFIGMPGIIAGFPVTIVPLIGASFMAGVIGAGGLGDLAIRYGPTSASRPPS